MRFHKKVRHREGPDSMVRASGTSGLLLRSNLRRQAFPIGGPTFVSLPQCRSQELGAGIALVTNSLIVENYNFLSWVYQRWPQNSL